MTSKGLKIINFKYMKNLIRAFVWGLFLFSTVTVFGQDYKYKQDPRDKEKNQPTTRFLLCVKNDDYGREL